MGLVLGFAFFFRLTSVHSSGLESLVLPGLASRRFGVVGVCAGRASGRRSAMFTPPMPLDAAQAVMSVGGVRSPLMPANSAFHPVTPLPRSRS